MVGWRMYKANDTFFWERLWLYAGGIHAAVVGILVILRKFYFGFFQMRLPEPQLYGDLSAAFLITVGFWLIWAGYKGDHVPELWVIPAGSATGRLIYFILAVIGFFLKKNEILYVVVGLSDVFFTIVLGWTAWSMFQAGKIKPFSNAKKR